MTSAGGFTVNVGGVMSMVTCLTAVSILLPNPERVALTLAVMATEPRSVVFAAKVQEAHGVEPEPVGVAL